MTMTPRSMVRAVGLGLARWLGATVVDGRTGQPLGRALFLPWRGRIVVIGLGEQVHPVRAVFLPQERLTYWKQEIGFTTLPEPDFPSEPAGNVHRAATGRGESAPPDQVPSRGQMAPG